MKSEILKEAIALIRGEEVATLALQNRNLLEENHRLRVSEGRLREEQGRLLGLFDLRAGDKKPRDIVWLVEDAIERFQMDVKNAEIKMLERIVASINTPGMGIDIRIGTALDKMKQESYDKGWNEGIEKYKSVLKSFFEILERKMK